MSSTKTKKKFANFEKTYKYKIESGMSFGKYLSISLLLILNIYIIYWFVSNADQFYKGILSATVITAFLAFMYIQIFQFRSVYILNNGIVIRTSIFGKYNTFTAAKLWEETEDTVYKRLSSNRIRIGFWTDRIDTSKKSRTVLSLLLNYLSPLKATVASRAVYIIKGSPNQIDYIENKLNKLAKKGIF